MALKSRALKVLQQVAEKNKLYLYTDKKYCMFHYDKDKIPEALECENKVSRTIVDADHFRFIDFIFPAKMYNAEVDEFMENCSGTANIRFCLDMVEFSESTVIVQDVFQEMVSMTLSMSDLLYLLYEVEMTYREVDDLDSEKMFTRFKNLKPADLVFLYYVVCRKKYNR